MESRWQLVVGGGGEGVVGLSKKEKGLMDMDNSVGTTKGREVYGD